MRERVELFGGTLELDSAPGRGTRIAVIGAARAGGRSMSRIRVLIADDHAIVREGVRALLALSDDIDVVGEAANGQRGHRARAHARARTSS